MSMVLSDGQEGYYQGEFTIGAILSLNCLDYSASQLGLNGFGEFDHLLDLLCILAILVLPVLLVYLDTGCNQGLFVTRKDILPCAVQLLETAQDLWV